MNTSGIHYIRDSKGGIYEIEEENLEKALAVDDDYEYLYDYKPGVTNQAPETSIATSPGISSQQQSSPMDTQTVDPSTQPPSQVAPQPGESNSEANVFMRDKDGGVFEIPQANVEEAKKAGGIIVDRDGNEPADPEPDSWGKLAARSLKTIGSEIVGAIPDTAAAIYNIPASIQNATRASMEKFDPNYMGENDFVPVSQQQDLPLIPSAAAAVDSAIDKTTNDYTKTQEGDSLQSALRLGTAVATPGGLAKTAAKYGQKGASKVLSALGTTEKKGIASAAATGAITEEANKAGYGVPASIALGLAGGAGASISAAAFNQLNKRLALASLTGNSPKNINLDAVKAAENQGLDYMNTLVNESNGLAVGEQLVSKTPYFGTRQAKKADIIDKQYAQAVDQAINDVGKKIVDSDSSFDIGSMIKDTFEKVKDSVKNEKNALYETANLLLPEGDAISPKNLINAVNDIRKNTKTLVASPDESFVLSYLDKIERGVVIGGENARMIAPVPVDMLVGSKISINDIINWDVNASGAKNQLRKIQQAIKNDLEEYGKKNPEWYNKFNEADAFYGKYLGDEALGSNTLRSIYKQENPEKILPSLNKISDFKAIEQSLGSQSNGQHLFNSIKREKLTDLIMGKAINPTSGTISYAGFSKALESPANKELIKYLSGDKYKDLQDFNAYAKAAVRRNQRNPNPSGTASTKTVISTLIAGITGVAVRGSIAGVGAASAPIALGFGVGKLFEWVLNNKRQLNVAIKGAKSIANGDSKAAGTYSQRLLRDIEKDLGSDFFRQLIALSK